MSISIFVFILIYICVYMCINTYILLKERILHHLAGQDVSTEQQRSWSLPPHQAGWSLPPQSLPPLYLILAHVKTCGFPFACRLLKLSQHHARRPPKDDNLKVLTLNRRGSRGGIGGAESMSCKVQLCEFATCDDVGTVHCICLSGILEII